jgi:hypothetical protein
LKYSNNLQKFRPLMHLLNHINDLLLQPNTNLSAGEAKAKTWKVFPSNQTETAARSMGWIAAASILWSPLWAPSLRVLPEKSGRRSKHGICRRRVSGGFADPAGAARHHRPISRCRHWVSAGQWQMNDIGRNHGVLGGPGIPKCNPWVSPECARLHPSLFKEGPAAAKGAMMKSMFLTSVAALSVLTASAAHADELPKIFLGTWCTDMPFRESKDGMVRHWRKGGWGAQQDECDSKSALDLGRHGGGSQDYSFRITSVKKTWFVFPEAYGERPVRVWLISFKSESEGRCGYGTYMFEYDARRDLLFIKTWQSKSWTCKGTDWRPKLSASEEAERCLRLHPDEEQRCADEYKRRTGRGLCGVNAECE